MDFVRDARRARSPCLHEGAVLAEGTHRRRSAPTRGSSKSIWGARPMLRASRNDRPLLRRRPGAARRLAARPRPGEVTCVLGRNGVGKTSLLRADRRASSRSARGTIGWDGQDIAGCRPTTARRRGIAYVPQGREIFPLLTVQENLETGLAPLAPRHAPHPGRDLRAVPGAQDHAAPARRRPLGRPAAAARDRPRAGDAAEAADPRRADRGHPAVDHQGYRPRHHLPARRAATWRSCWSSSITTSPANSPTYRGDGARRGGAGRPGPAWSRPTCSGGCPSRDPP